MKRKVHAGIKRLVCSTAAFGIFLGLTSGFGAICRGWLYQPPIDFENM